MEIDYGVQRMQEIYDFAGVKLGASIWTRTKSEAVSLSKVFTSWAKANGVSLLPTIECAGHHDPRGQGWRVHFVEAGHYKSSVNESNMRAVIETWVRERLVFQSAPPRGGWLLVSQLHQDYRLWFEDRASFQEGSLCHHIAKFSRILASIPGVKRTRISAGSVIMGVAMKPVATPAPTPAHDDDEEEEQIVPCCGLPIDCCECDVD